MVADRKHQKILMFQRGIHQNVFIVFKFQGNRKNSVSNLLCLGGCDRFKTAPCKARTKTVS